MLTLFEVWWWTILWRMLKSSHSCWSTSERHQSSPQPGHWYVGRQSFRLSCPCSPSCKTTAEPLHYTPSTSKIRQATIWILGELHCRNWQIYWGNTALFETGNTLSPSWTAPWLASTRSLTVPAFLVPYWTPSRTSASSRRRTEWLNSQIALRWPSWSISWCLCSPLAIQSSSSSFSLNPVSRT